MSQKYFYAIWSVIGVLVLGATVVFVSEFVSHGASWDGVYDAHVKHTIKAYGDRGINLPALHRHLVSKERINTITKEIIKVKESKCRYQYYKEND